MYVYIYIDIYIYIYIYIYIFFNLRLVLLLFQMLFQPFARKLKEFRNIVVKLIESCGLITKTRTENINRHKFGHKAFYDNHNNPIW